MSVSAPHQALFDKHQYAVFRYFERERNPANGLVADTTRAGAPASIAAVGLGLTCYPVAAERGYIDRHEAAERARTTLAFFHDAAHSDAPDATGYHGFYYHFLDMETGRRARKSELSTIDTALLLAGALTVAAYFDGDGVESEVRDLAHALYTRADWTWALNGFDRVAHGWRPERGFLPYHWHGYDEGILLYLLGLGSPTHPLPAASYAAYQSSYKWKRLYGYDVIYAGPLFIHQLPQVWVDFRGIHDAFLREHDLDYFENSRRAVFIQQQYAIRNPRGLRGYGEHTWGFSASDGPGRHVCTVDGRERRFYGYRARGVPFGPDDGTVAPWSLFAALPFAPEVVLPAIEWLDRERPDVFHEYGFVCAFNDTFPAQNGAGWVSEGYFGLDQGPVLLMIENYRTELVWSLMRRCPYLRTGLQRAGFTGGWLGAGGREK